MSEKYHFQNGIMVLSDPELGINLQISFQPLLLPTWLRSSYAPLEGEKLVVEPAQDSTPLSAHFEKDGVREGQFRKYYPNGKVQAEGYYLHGKLHGPSMFFSEAGGKLAESWFVNGSLQGKSRYYYASGQLYAQKRYRDGKLEGLQEYFYELGNTRTLMSYSAGRLHGDVRLYWENGQPKRIAYYKDGKRNGWDRIWDEKGMLIDEGQFQEGNPVGVHTRRWPNGSRREEVIYGN